MLFVHQLSRLCAVRGRFYLLTSCLLFGGRERFLTNVCAFIPTLSGRIPSEYAQLSKLKTMLLEANKLTGTLVCSCMQQDLFVGRLAVSYIVTHKIDVIVHIAHCTLLFN